MSQTLEELNTRIEALKTSREILDGLKRLKDLGYLSSGEVEVIVEHITTAVLKEEVEHA